MDFLLNHVSYILHHKDYSTKYYYRQEDQTDENIKKLLHTIFSYVNADSETAEKIRNNFLIIERDNGSENTEVIPFDIIVDNKNIRVNKIKTDNFTAVYQALSELRLPISAMDIRKVQDIVGDPLAELI